MSVRQQVFSSAASAWVSGGTSRVLTVPATDALAIIAIAQKCSDIAAPPAATRPSGLGAAEFGSYRATGGEESLDCTHEAASELLLIAALPQQALLGRIGQAAELDECGGNIRGGQHGEIGRTLRTL